MTLAFRNQLSQAANQMRALLATAPPDWTAAEDASATISLLALEEEIAVNIEHSDALINEAARFEEGQRLFLSAFGKLPSGSKDAEQKTYDDLLGEIRLDELQAECRQMISSLARRVRAYKRQESELRAQIAQAQARATTHVALEDNDSRDTSLLRDIVQQNQQMMQNMQDMLQAFTLQNRPAGPTADDQSRAATPAAVTAVNSTASPVLITTALSINEPQPTANNTLQSTTRNMGTQSTLTPHSSQWTMPTGTGFGGQYQGHPQNFSSSFVPQMPSNTVHHAFSTPSRFHLPLPTLEIPHFSGERSKWRPFWHMFELVTKNIPELSDLERHTLLLTYLKGDAMKLIDGIPLSHGNFQIVVDILKKRYDNRPQLITDLYSESPNHNPILWKIVYDKLSTQYLSKLLAKEPSGTNWTAHSIQAAIWEVIEREEKIAEHKAEHRTERPSKDLNEREEEPDQYYTILSTMVDQKKRPEP
ncbi:hypothetical protein DdX_00336 [Ditylenchus destructor]|uniref:Uncharacterized protein n=1 Tax=Ditylenchus destructor TaxID=166010 RepID=A0AAD4NH74_9BILA|nr:hypothetical protein DdX_00336 [Ditylenchus destructor]